MKYNSVFKIQMFLLAYPVILPIYNHLKLNQCFANYLTHYRQQKGLKEYNFERVLNFEDKIFVQSKTVVQLITYVTHGKTPYSIRKEYQLSFLNIIILMMVDRI